MPDFFAELHRTANRHPGSIAFTSVSGSLDYEALLQNIENIADNASAHGLGEGHMVHVECASPELLLLLVLGLLRAGVTVGVTREIAAYAEHGVELDAVLHDKPASRPAALASKRWLMLAADWFKPARGKKSPRNKNAQYALIVGSSGSTGRTKLICVSRSNLEYRIAGKYDDPYFGGDVRYFSTAGNTSMSTLSDYLITLMKGGLIIRSNVRTGRAALDVSSLYQPSYVAMAPLTLVDVLGTLGRSPRKIRKIDYLRLTGAYCSADTRREALAQYAANIITSYGATEIGRVAWGDFADIGDTRGSVGTIAGEMTVETVDENRKPLPPGTEGELRIRPPAKAVTTYASAAGEVLTDGWFYPGDLGRIDPGGRLIVTGRKSTVINLGGNKINPEVAEAVLLAAPGIKDVAVAPQLSAHGYQTICAVVASDGPVTLDAINKYLARKNERFSVNSLKRVPSVPRGASGKIDRPAVLRIVERLSARTDVKE